MSALSKPRLHVETFAVGPLGCNCTVLADPDAKRAIVIDPGEDAERIRAAIAEGGFTVDAIVHTHTHIDHVGATASLQAATGAPALFHEADLFLYRMLDVQADLIGLRAPAQASLDRFLADGDTVRAGSIELGVLHTPGHTPGSSTFVVAGHDLVLAGDTLFSGSIGRTDLWGGDTDSILRSIRERILTLPDTTRVICGHGPDTTVGREKRLNPFVGAAARF